ncbi:hypothetical protein Q1W73_06460 [Asticcacaulis sp. ZE23SCel15]|uniref:hypothetical protein n=1 Tax=Asticcacaulis sp. ZE23SCel15 TaxID=3059027 RepID=UPI00265E5E7A|nr:hypothetical protein [Asticcacaulis sp. ZE23SCel15]WKL58623.1 hypothetical protein Q1W73_06460 [Asticcacaulis sp. ZE23SCel15]
MWYRVMLKGENFRTKTDGKTEILGFYTTRYVEAGSEDEAEHKAVDLIRKDESLKKIVLNAKDDPPLIYLEEIDVVLSDHSNEPVMGYVFYPDKN